MGVGNGLAASGMPFFFLHGAAKWKASTTTWDHDGRIWVAFYFNGCRLAVMGNEREELYRRLKNCPRDAMQR
jgi:hypothetical protein